MTAARIHWGSLRPGDLFKSRDDAYPLRVVALLTGGVLVVERGVLVKVFFRPGAVVLRLHQRLARGSAALT